MPLGTRGPAVVVLVAMVAIARLRGAAIDRGAVAAGLVGIVAAWLLCGVAKRLVERPRPIGRVDGLVVRGESSGFAFPSSHTTVAFAAAVAAAVLLPARWRIAAFGVAAAVGLSRLYVGVHWPSDVVGGAGLGLVVGIATQGVARRVGDAATRRSAGTIRPA